MAQDIFDICPLLGMEDDRETKCIFSIVGHRCFRGEAAVTVSLDHQDRYCLGRDYRTCPDLPPELMVDQPPAAVAPTSEAAPPPASELAPVASAPAAPAPSDDDVRSKLEEMGSEETAPTAGPAMIAETEESASAVGAADESVVLPAATQSPLSADRQPSAAPMPEMPATEGSRTEGSLDPADLPLAEAQAGQTPTESGGGNLDQAALDALLAGFGADDPPSPATSVADPSDAPLEAAPSDLGGGLSQEALDALLAAGAEALDSVAPEAPDPAATADVEAANSDEDNSQAGISQEALDALLKVDYDTSPPAPQISTTFQPGAPTLGGVASGAEGSSAGISQDELDALLALNYDTPEPAPPAESSAPEQTAAAPDQPSSATPSAEAGQDDLAGLFAEVQAELDSAASISTPDSEAIQGEEQPADEVTMPAAAGDEVAGSTPEAGDAVGQDTKPADAAGHAKAHSRGTLVLIGMMGTAAVLLGAALVVIALYGLEGWPPTDEMARAATAPAAVETASPPPSVQAAIAVTPTVPLAAAAAPAAPTQVRPPQPAGSPTLPLVRIPTATATTPPPPTPLPASTPAPAWQLRLGGAALAMVPPPAPSPTVARPAITPSAATGPTSASTVRHTVASGENLTVIARRYNTTVDAIMAANNLSDQNHIYSGMVLNIPRSP